jgi:glutathione synthase/RimK-type ligase-like ATP-grasp enzyme
LSVALLYEHLETDEMGIRLTAKEMGIDLVHIPFRKISVSIQKEGFRIRSIRKDYDKILKKISVVLNRAQSKNRRLYAGSILETFDKEVINSSYIEYLCFSKLRTLLQFCKNGIDIPQTVFVPCDAYDSRRDGGKISNIKIIADLIQNELGNSNIVVKPDAGTHGMYVRLARDRDELLNFLKETEPSIINPIGITAQEMIDKWFYDLRIIVYKEKGKSPSCHPIGMARAGFKDFRTNTYLGNMVFGIKLPQQVIDNSIKCGEAIGVNDEVWVLALDAMPDVGKEKIVDDSKVISELNKLTTPFNQISEVKRDKNKYKDFFVWNHRLEDAFQKYMELEAYQRIKEIIEESVEKKRKDIYFHEINACPEFWEQTRLITGINIAKTLLECVKSVNR